MSLGSLALLIASYGYFEHKVEKRKKQKNLFWHRVPCLTSQCLEYVLYCFLSPCLSLTVNIQVQPRHHNSPRNISVYFSNSF